MKVVLVEDNANLRVSLRMALELDGLEISEAADGEAGVARILEDQVDVAVVDLALPSIDGFEVARRVRTSRPAIRLIALSGYRNAADVKHARDAGFDLLVTKPIDPEKLARLIRGASA